MVSPVVLLLAMFMGAALLVSAAYARMWRGIGAQPHHPWMAVFSLFCALVCVLRVAQMTTTDPEEAIFLARLFGSGAFLVSVMWVRVVRTMAGQQVATPFYVGFLALEVGSSVALWFPQVLEPTPLMRTDAAGFEFWGLTPGPFAPVLFLSGLGMAAAIVGVAWGFPRERGTERSILVLSSLLASSLVLTTYLSVTVAPWLPPLGILGLPVLILPSAAVLAQQQDDLARTLEVRVRDRTRSLNIRNVELEEALQRAESARESQARFLANVSHELRTPLTGVLGMIDLVRRNLEDPEAPGLLRIAKRSGLELLSLINELLDAARIEAQMVVLERQDVPLRRLLDDVLNAHGPAAQSKGLKLHRDIDESVPRAVKTDPTRLKQILHNLIGNAVKFTSDGEVRLRVRGGERLVLEVLDTGPGLGGLEGDALFSRFTQADDSTTRVYGGTGLGLSIARDLARLMGGDLTAHDQDPRGAAFRLDIPCEVATAPEDPPTPPSDVGRPLFAGQVLVVDDDATNRLVVSRMLRAYGVEVELAKDGQEALDALAERTPALVLMDCYMPRVDGFEATRQLKERGFTAPIVALTASAGAADRAASIAAGMDDHLAKPIVIKELEDVLRRYLGSRNA